MKRRGKEQKGGTWKKKKSNKSEVDPMVLIEGDIDDISDKVRDTMTKVLHQFEQKYMQTLGSI